VGWHIEKIKTKERKGKVSCKVIILLLIVDKHINISDKEQIHTY